MAGAIRVAVLGGGMGSLAAAWELVRGSDADRYRIDVYQRDWRLGGKGTSGRSPDAERGARIEEHGIHVLPGFYDHSFRVLREVYEDVAGSRDRDKILPWREAFIGSDDVVMADPAASRLKFWKVTFPRNRRRLGGAPRRASVPTLYARGSRRFRGLRRRLLRASGAPWRGLWARDALSASVDGLLRLLLDTRLVALAPARRLARRLAAFHERRLVHDLDAAHRWAGPPPQPDAQRRLWIAVWFAGTNLLGLLREDLLLPPRDFLRLDEWDYDDWLRSHSEAPVPAGEGAAGRVPPVQALYDLAFSDAHTLGAGTTLFALLGMALDYKGHFVYEMKGGMGDVVFAPLFLALDRRPNVCFHFFHEVEEVVADPARRSIAAIRLRRHAEQSGSPLVPFRVGGRTLHCWPSRPLSAKEHPSERETLHAGKDFDVVVLGISHRALPRICPTLRVEPAFAAMLDGLESVPTQSLQLWMKRSLEELGCPLGSSMLISFVRPFNSWTDMKHLLPYERWPEGAVRTLAYFSDELPRSETEGRDPEELVFENARKFLEGPVRELWPEFEYGDLHDPSGGKGPERLRFQHLRANVDDSDHYVLCAKGTTAKRLAPSRSGFANLALAGDWVKTELNAGCLEAATLGGIGAGRAIRDGSVRPA